MRELARSELHKVESVRHVWETILKSKTYTVITEFLHHLITALDEALCINHTRVV